MSAIAGKGGFVKINTNVIGEVQTWSCDIGTNVIGTTAMLKEGIQWKNFIAGVSEWTVSMELSWDIPTAGSNQAAINTASLQGTLLSAIELYANATNYYTGDGIITSANVNNDVQDKVSYMVEIQGTGALTYA